MRIRPMTKVKTFGDTKLTRKNREDLRRWAYKQAHQSLEMTGKRLTFVCHPLHNLRNAAATAAMAGAAETFFPLLEERLYAAFPDQDMEVLARHNRVVKGGIVTLDIPCTAHKDLLAEIGDAAVLLGYPIPALKMVPAPLRWENTKLPVPEEAGHFITAWVAWCKAVKEYNTTTQALQEGFCDIVRDAIYWRDIFCVLPEDKCKALFVEDHTPRPVSGTAAEVATAIQTLFQS